MANDQILRWSAQGGAEKGAVAGCHEVLRPGSQEGLYGDLLAKELAKGCHPSILRPATPTLVDALDLAGHHRDIRSLCARFCLNIEVHIAVLFRKRDVREIPDRSNLGKP